ncbi:MAG: succinylglutamate desuccinylase/aspartoacylase family protein [Aurantibacter sp.]
MPDILRPYLEEKKIKRFIGSILGSQKGPTVVFFGGVHGNELSGSAALTEVMKELIGSSAQIKGNVFGIRANIPAQLKNQRFLDEDLNRLWAIERIRKIHAKLDDDLNSEERELIEIHKHISNILAGSSPPFYFVDLHSTSSETPPFITINDALINRRFSKQFPVPIVLGIEEYLEGPLLSYINQKGYVSLGFESGMHTDDNSIKNCISFIWLTLGFTGILNTKDVAWFKLHYNRLKEAARGKKKFYEVIYRHSIRKDEKFKMQEGFDSFRNVSKRTLLAKQDTREIRAEKDSILFMPLYQDLGDDGFFLIRKIPNWALNLSTFFRTLKMDGLLARLPGISWNDKSKGSLLVDTGIAKFLTKPFFHLLGYRNRLVDKDHVLMHNRERVAKTEMYSGEWWYKNKSF